uniref:ubiquitin-like protein ISG15 n=1 Tax=Scatophagus argus TaxID=75038 RepID=UPI001ED7D927|nr:ubiquitin-like protein ISG15 [Scatophagus argus]
MDINIVMLNGTSHTLRVNPFDKVGDLKMRIRDIFCVAPERQKLIFVNGQKTTLSDDSRTISSYGLQSGSQVSLLITEPPTIQVFLKNEKGQNSTYDIKPDETVSTFKSKVEAREGVPVSQQRLLHESKEMTGGKLADYNVKNQSTIYLMLRLRGG